MSFLLAVFAAAMTYVYMQWPTIIGLFTPIALILLGAALVMLLMFLANDSDQARSKVRN